MAEQMENGLLSLTNDYVFRRIFGVKNTPALAEFLAAVLDITVEELGELTVNDPHLHRNRKGGKSNELDILVRSKSGEIVNVEVQVNPKPAFRERLAFMNSKLFAEQMKRGQEYETLRRTVTVVIADFDLIKESKDCFHRFQWYNPMNGTSLTNAQEIDVLELIKLPKEDDGSALWKWMKFIKSGREDEMEELAKKSNAMQEVVHTLKEMSEDEYERRLAFQRDKDERDRLAEISYGRYEGIEIGEARAKNEIARSMKEYGDPIEKIADITGLSAEEIEKL